MDRLIPVRNQSDILPALRGTPIETLLAYQNLGVPHTSHERAELLIGMCMDNRKHLRIPENFAFIIRAGGGNLRYSEFKVSYAIAIGGVSAIALLGGGSAHFIASDAHSAGPWRPPDLGVAVQAAADAIGLSVQALDWMVSEGPAALLEGGPVRPPKITSARRPRGGGRPAPAGPR